MYFLARPIHRKNDYFSGIRYRSFRTPDIPFCFGVAVFDHNIRICSMNFLLYWLHTLWASLQRWLAFSATPAVDVFLFGRTLPISDLSDAR